MTTHNWLICCPVLQDPALAGTLEDRRGIYRHPIIQKAINSIWFVNQSDEGVLYNDYFNPISNATIALVLTMVCPCRDIVFNG